MRAILTLLCIFTVTLSAWAQQKEAEWQAGFYINGAGQKVKGLMSWWPSAKSFAEGDGDKILFKATETDQIIKLSTDTIKQFSIGTDNFVVSSNPILSRLPILKVLLDKHIKIYQAFMLEREVGGVYNLGHVTESKTFYYGTSPDDITLFKRDNFTEVICSIMADNAKAVAAVREKRFKHDSLFALVVFYKTGTDPRNAISNDDAY